MKQAQTASLRGSDVSESKSVVVTKLTEAIDLAFDVSINNSIPGFAGAEELACKYFREDPQRKREDRNTDNQERDKAIDKLVKWQVMAAGAAGFATGIGGLITLPAAIPANLLSVLAIQLRMIAAIAIIRGYDARQNKGLIIACLVGTSATDVLKDIGISVGSKLAAQVIQKIPGAVITKLNQAVGFRLMTKAGVRGIINLPKVIPIVGGLISGGFDAGTTHLIARVAKSIFEHAPPEDVPSFKLK